MSHRALIGSCRWSAMPPSATAPTSASRTAKILRIKFPPAKASSAQLAQRPCVTGDERLAIAMAPARHDPLTRPKDAVDELAPAGEDPAVENLIPRALEECRMGAAQRDQ